MSRLLLSTIVFALILGSLPARNCTCTEAREHEVPHGANEFIELAGGTVKSIKGRVIYAHDDSPVDEVVVEAYQITPDDKKLTLYDLVRQRNRRVACVTTKDGSFCFDNLPSGKYLLRAGTLSGNAGMNEMYMKVNLDRSWWSRWFRSDKGLEFRLTPGT